MERGGFSRLSLFRGVSLGLGPGFTGYVKVLRRVWFVKNMDEEGMHKGWKRRETQTENLV